MIASSIAHEFNNILTPMVSYGSLAAQCPDDINLQRTAIARMVQAAERASEVSKAILSLASGGAPGTQRCEVDAAVSGLIQALCGDDRRSRIRITTMFHVKPVARIRSVVLQQVLLNLYLNAKAAMPSGGRFDILVDQTDQVELSDLAMVGAPPPSANPVVLIRCTDDGPGIGPESRGSLWSGHGTSKRHDGTTGSGFGLMTCRRLIEQAGGGIWFEDAPDGGAMFTVALVAE